MNFVLNQERGPPSNMAMGNAQGAIYMATDNFMSIVLVNNMR